MDAEPTPSVEHLMDLDNVTLLQDDQDKGKGKLSLTSLTVTWTGNGAELSWGYRSIMMHAVSKAGNSPAIYAQLAGADDDELLELRFVPEDGNRVEELFAALSKGAAMNPDEPEDEEGAGDFYFNADEVQAGLGNGDFEEDEEYDEGEGDAEGENGNAANASS